MSSFYSSQARHVSSIVFGVKRYALRLAFCLLLAILTVPSAQALAQGTGQVATITVTARAGYGDTGEYIIGDWLPIRVTLDNPAGGTSRRVRVEVASRGSDDSITSGLYARDLDLPASSHKEVTLYAYSGSYTRRFTVRVMDGTTAVASAEAAADPYEPPSNVIIGVASSDSSLLNVLKGEQVGRVVNSLPPGGYGGYSGTYLPYLPNSYNGSASALATVAHISLADIPALSQALDSLGIIVLDGVDTGTLSAEQLAALESWVSRGGMLIAASRPGAPDVTAGIADLLPVSTSGTQTLASLDSLRDFVGAASSPSGQIQVPAAALRPEASASSRVLAQQDGIPIIAERNLGLGQVIYMGVSPGVPPLGNNSTDQGWAGTLPLMKKLLADHSIRLTYGGFLRFSPSRGYYSGSLFDTYGGMFAIPSLDLPDSTLIGFFLFLYIVIIGPVNFIVLRRLRRVELAWLTVPALVLVFSAVSYLLAFQSKGGDLIAIRANIVNTFPGVDEATFAQHFGLFSPVRRTYNLRLPADSAVTEMNSYGYYQAGSDSPSPVLGGNPTSIGDVNIDTWSLRAFVAEHTGKAQSPVESHLHLGNNLVVGTLKNRTRDPLNDVALVRGNAVSYVGYLAPGEEKDVRLEVSSGRFDNSSPAKLLPVPPGVTPPSSGLTYPYRGGQGNSAAQRTYDRKVELLSAGLYPLIADEPPEDMSVIVLAWGPPVANFEVEGHSTSTEDLNLWSDLVPVDFGAANQQAALPVGSVPYTVYAPGNNPSVFMWGGGGAISPSGGPGAVPTPLSTAAPGSPQGIKIPTPIVVTGGQAPAQRINISPYADVRYRLPAGTKPERLTLSYAMGDAAAGGDFDVLAYNANSGTWDLAGTVQVSGAGGHSGMLPIQNPQPYTGPAGDVTIRLKPKGGDTTLTDLMLNLELNGK